MAFDFTDQYVTLPTPGFSAFTSGFTVIVVMRRTSTAATQYVLGHSDVAATSRWKVGLASGALFVNHPNGGGYAASGFSTATATSATTDGWIILAFSHSGSASAGRFHKYVYSTDTWTHEAGTGGTVQPLLGDPSGSMLLGRFAAGSSGFSADGDYAFVGVYPADMADFTLENLVASLGSLRGRQASTTLQFDGATIVDLATGAAPTASTATVSPTSSPLSYGHPVIFDAQADSGLPALPPAAASSAQLLSY